MDTHVHRERVSKRILIKCTSQVKYTYTILKAVTLVSTILGTQSQPSLISIFTILPRVHPTKGTIVARVRVLRVWLLSKFFSKNVDWKLPKKKHKTRLKYCITLQFCLYITAKSHPRQKSMFPIFLSSIRGYFCHFKASMLPVRDFLGHGDYMSSKYLSSTKLSRKHMPMNLL